MLSAHNARKAQAGLSIVELMVGVAVGLVVVAGALSLFASSVSGSRKLTVEMRVNQDLRAAADIIARDLKRGGYWENAIAGTVRTATGASVVANPNPVPSATPGTSTVTYSVARDTLATRCTAIPCTNNALDTDEQSGFRLTGGVLQMQVGAGNWQPLTDAALVTVNNFELTPTETVVDIRDVCEKTCVGTTCPTITVRSYLLRLKGTAVSDTAVTRVIQERIRLRNDTTAGACPA